MCTRKERKRLKPLQILKPVCLKHPVSNFMNRWFCGCLMMLSAQQNRIERRMDQDAKRLSPAHNGGPADRFVDIESPVMLIRQDPTESIASPEKRIQLPPAMGVQAVSDVREGGGKHSISLWFPGFYFYSMA